MVHTTPRIPEFDECLCGHRHAPAIPCWANPEPRMYISLKRTQTITENTKQELPNVKELQLACERVLGEISKQVRQRPLDKFSEDVQSIAIALEYYLDMGLVMSSSLLRKLKG